MEKTNEDFIREYEDGFVKIPIKYLHYKAGTEAEGFIISNIEGTVLGDGAIATGKTFEEAEKQFIRMAELMCKHNARRAHYLGRYEWFRKGDWKGIGGRWFTALGIHVSFRYGKNMQGGRYIPFTDLNISIANLWRSVFYLDKKNAI